MTGKVQAHETSISMVKSASVELDAGSDIALKVKVSCPSNCNLQGSKVRIAGDAGAVVKEIELVSFDGLANKTGEFVVKAPGKPGKHTWTALFAAQEKADILHEASSTLFSFIVKLHATSMAVWDVPSPIVFNTKFNLKVGVHCPVECKLTGREVEIYDHQGAIVTTGTLGDVPWSDTGDLYWAEVELEAPGTEGYYTWTVKFPKPDLELPHEAASYTFGFVTVRHPEHVVTVEAIDKDEKTPVENAEVILSPYRGCTNERGVAKIEIPEGRYEIYVLKRGDYQAFQTPVEVASDIAIKAELMPEPAEDEAAGYA